LIVFPGHGIRETSPVGSILCKKNDEMYTSYYINYVDYIDVNMSDFAISVLLGPNEKVATFFGFLSGIFAI
jgi:hypothetical protein